MNAHRGGRRLRVAAHQRLDDRLVLAAIDEPPLGAEGAALDVEPELLAADEAQDLVEMVEELVARAGENPLVQFGVPVLEPLDLDRLDGGVMGGGDRIEIGGARIGLSESGGARLD